jgi:hypothetical protein
MARIKFLHILATGCHPQGVFKKKGIQVQHADLGTVMCCITTFQSVMVRIYDGDPIRL